MIRTMSIEKPGTKFKIDEREYETVGVVNRGGYMCHDYKSVLTVTHTNGTQGPRTFECMFKPHLGTYVTEVGISHGNMIGWKAEIEG
ncbi:MAG: hypothetical protein ACRCWQ_02110 [Bacilli bacterium]